VSAGSPPAPLPTSPLAAQPPTRRPRRSVVVLRTVGVLVVLALLLAGAMSLVGQFFAQQRTETTTVSEQITRLIARTDTGNVRIRQGAAGAPIQVSRTVHWSFREPRTSVVAADGLLTVAGTCDSGFWIGNCSTDLDVVLPPGVALDLRTDTGDVVASGTAAVTARTDTGNITLTAPGSPSVDVRTAAGEVTVTGAGAGARVQARADVGRLRLALAQAPSAVQARTDTGDITVTVPPGTSYHVVATTDTGDARISVPIDTSAPRSIDVMSSTGNVTVRAS